MASEWSAGGNNATPSPASTCVTPGTVGKRKHHNQANFVASSSSSSTAAAAAESPRQSSEQISDTSPPITPDNRKPKRNPRLRGIQAHRKRPSLRDVLDNFTGAVTNTNSTTLRDRSNSNGLSWSPAKHARNSVVENMLLSLDNFEFASESSSFFDTKDYHIDLDNYPATPPAPLPPPPRQRALSSSSASSSDYGSAHPPQPIQRAAPRHRSNGSVNFQSSLGRIDSVRVNGQEVENSTPPRGRTAIKRELAGTDSRSSSLELERSDQVPYRINRRSQSFDLGHSKMAWRSTAEDALSQDDATLPLAVPVYPRTQPSAALRPGTVTAPLPRDIQARAGSARSPVRDLDRASSEITPRSTNEASAQESAVTDDTPSKTLPSPVSMDPPPVKENQKPGFFRKMFGSTRISQEGSAQKRTYQKPPSAMQMRPSMQADGSDAAQIQSLQRTLTRDRSAKDQQQPLTKKTSFFRRRRKSLQDAPIPQLPQGNQEKDANVELRPESQGSLQKVMDQYYETSRRMDMNGNSLAHRKKNSALGGDGTSTIRAVGATGDSVVSASKRLSRTSMDKEPTQVREIENKGHARTASNTSKSDQRSKIKSPTIEKKLQNVNHSRNQSDIDKDLPRLPVDYSAIKSDTPKEIPTSKYNLTTSKPPSRESAASLNPGQAQSTTTTPSKLVANGKTSPTSSSRREIDSLGQTEANASTSNPHTRITSAELRRSQTDSRATPVDSLDDNHDDLADETKEALMFSVQDVDEPTEEHKATARKLFDGTSSIDQAEIAAWLGEFDTERGKVRQAYMERFDWTDMSILGALRSFCNHVQLKGETQQVDRILDTLSRRWCESNPKHGFKATDVVHTICYSILLLNTDLHMADIEQKMTRSQFIKNTLPTIRRVVTDAAPHAFDNARASMLPPRRQTEPTISTSATNTDTTSEAELRPTHRLQARASDHSGHDTINDNDECGPLVKSAYYGKLNGWETQIETVLRNIYNSIRNQRLPLSSYEEERRVEAPGSTLGLSGATGSALRRTNSLLSKAGSETLPIRGRIPDLRLGGKWSYKGRSRSRLYPASLAHSRTSFDDGESAISPSMSSMWSKHSLGKTSMSVTSFASAYPTAEYQRSIGFANALSQAIIRDEPTDESTEEFLRAGPLLEDESLELEGAPWAKEGILQHKHHLESVDKKAKNRNWNECFTVIEKGWIRLFQFNMNSKSTRQRSQRMAGGGVVGGGNWSENAQSLGQFLLRHTIASALPPPGYSKARPHVWALSLPTGAVHLFQAGTPEIVKEFVSTANYWSARLSKEPLVGGVSNIEYGWSERVINMALIETSRTPSNAPSARPSMSQSIRTSFDQGSSRAKLPGDKIPISEWSPPTQSMMASQLLEVDQLSALQVYVGNIEEELKKHNELRSPMLLAFTPRQSNHARAMNNWERKSSYLLREIVKFSTYLESLQFAQKEVDRVKAEKQAKEEERAKLADAQTEVHELAGSTPAAAADTADTADAADAADAAVQEPEASTSGVTAA